MRGKGFYKLRVVTLLFWLIGSLFLTNITQPNILVQGNLNTMLQTYDIDVFTQYPAPYGGQGKNMPSDAFTTRKVVILYTRLTYQSEPVQNKPVSIEIQSPQNITQMVAYTNSSGLATVEFTISNEEGMFGIWNIKSMFPVGDLNHNGKIDILDISRITRAFGSYPKHPKWDPVADITRDNKVDIRDIGLVAVSFGQTVVQDKLTFKVGYILKLITLETCDDFGNPRTVFAHGEHLCFNATIESISLVTRNVNVFIAAYDELGVVIIAISQNFSIPANEVVELFILGPIIPKHAFSGIGKAWANALLSGTTIAYCPSIFTTYIIWM